MKDFTKGYLWGLFTMIAFAIFVQVLASIVGVDDMPIAMAIILLISYLTFLFYKYQINGK